jgi:hypothetical protein
VTITMHIREPWPIARRQSDLALRQPFGSPRIPSPFGIRGRQPVVDVARGCPPILPQEGVGFGV